MPLTKLSKDIFVQSVPPGMPRLRDCFDIRRLQSGVIHNAQEYQCIERANLSFAANAIEPIPEPQGLCCVVPSDICKIFVDMLDETSRH